MSAPKAPASTKVAMWRAFEEIAGRTMMLVWLFFVARMHGTHLVNIVFGAEPSAMAAIDFAKTAMFLIFSLLAVGLTLFRRPAKAVAAGWEPRITAVLGTYLLLAIPLMPSGQVDAWFSSFAICLMIVGLLACGYSLFWLGRSYAIMASARKLVTAGPYSVVRHPLYACEIVLVAGVTMLNFSIWAVLLAFMIVLLLWRRMVNEERILIVAFPEYAEYAQRVPRIIPNARIWRGVGQRSALARSDGLGGKP